MSKPSGSKLVVYAALVGNLLIAISKFVAAALSGSSAMLSEGVHSLVDTTNEGLLLYGMRQAKQPPDNTHPFGHGRELYFWSLIVALSVLALGAGVSAYEGVQHLMHPEPIKSPLISYIVLGVSVLFEGTSWTLSLREVRRKKGDSGYFAAFRESKDPTNFTVLLEDSAALLGLLLAGIGVAGSAWLGQLWMDGAASLGIAAILGVAALLLARESKSLLIGEQARPKLAESILRTAGADRDIRQANGVLTMQMGPDTVVANLSAEFEDALATPQIEACILRIEKKTKTSHPELVALFVKPQTPDTWEERRSALEQRNREG